MFTVTKVLDAKKGTRTSKGMYKAGDIFQITYDNVHVRYYLNGSLYRTLSVGANRAFRAYVSVWDPDEYAITAFNFSPMGSRGATGWKLVRKVQLDQEVLMLSIQAQQ